MYINKRAICTQTANMHGQKTLHLLQMMQMTAYISAAYCSSHLQPAAFYTDNAFLCYQKTV